MPRRRDPLLTPREYMTAWPDGVIKPGAPAAVHYLRDICRTVRDTLEETEVSTADFTRMMNLDRSTVRTILNGYTWPDIVTVVKFEQALGVTVWPSWGDSRIRDLENQIVVLEEKLRAERAKARKKAAAARTAGRR